MLKKYDNTQVWESFSDLPHEHKAIVIDLIHKLKKSSDSKKQREEIESRREEIKKGEKLSHEDFWRDV